ncbi:hypothetical protein [Promicromonospora sp. MEB111]|uniref:hypothetical protein n=1 Tax=Promicromonospora sp. MEB111 TaxID=3040301 RepID=UPI00254A9E42|nr:hypothetical protein [Promicromonospora sp. MEB111]
MASHTLDIPGTSGHVELVPDMWWGRSYLTVDGNKAPSAGKRAFTLQGTDGRPLVATLGRTALFAAVPPVEVNGESHLAVDPPPVVVRVIGMLPILLVTFGGLLGALVAVIAIIVNFRVAGSRLPTGAKAGVMIAVTAAAYVIWLLSAGIIAASL